MISVIVVRRVLFSDWNSGHLVIVVKLALRGLSEGPDAV